MSILHGGKHQPTALREGWLHSCLSALPRHLEEEGVPAPRSTVSYSRGQALAAEMVPHSPVTAFKTQACSPQTPPVLSPGCS